jgi:hypothetical protein
MKAWSRRQFLTRASQLGAAYAELALENAAIKDVLSRKL